jgi:hypothetical protein
MAEYLNDYEAADAERLFTISGLTPNLTHAARIICELISWTDSNSDGWPYWAKPRNAAAALIMLVGGSRREMLSGRRVEDISEDDLNRALRPLKAFLTKQKVDWNADLPWAALLPAT